MENMYNAYSSLEYAVDTVPRSAIYPPQMSTSPTNSSSLSISAPPYITTTSLAPNRSSHTTMPHRNGRRVSPEYTDMDSTSKSHNYRSPTSSRKDFPGYMQGKRHSRAPSDDEEDELNEEPPAPSASEQEKSGWKRRQNTLAARRSRKRKLLYQQSLEMTVERLTMEKEVWKTRALTLKQLLQGHGITCPDFND